MRVIKDAVRKHKTPPYEQQLHVHRLVPNSAYTMDGCVTLCPSCHRKRRNQMSPPKKRPRLVTARGTPRMVERGFCPVELYLPRELADVVKARAATDERKLSPWLVLYLSRKLTEDGDF